MQEIKKCGDCEYFNEEKGTCRVEVAQKHIELLLGRTNDTTPTKVTSDSVCVLSEND